MNHEFMELQVLLSVAAHKAHSMHGLQKLGGMNSNICPMGPTTLQ